MRYRLEGPSFNKINMALIIETKNNASEKLLAEMLKHFDFVKTINRKSDKKIKPLSPDDWIKQGRPATDEEIEQLIQEMEADTDFVDAKPFFKVLKRKYTK